MAPFSRTHKLRVEPHCGSSCTGAEYDTKVEDCQDRVHEETLQFAGSLDTGSASEAEADSHQIYIVLIGLAARYALARNLGRTEVDLEVPASVDQTLVAHVEREGGIEPDALGAKLLVERVRDVLRADRHVAVFGCRSASHEGDRKSKSYCTHQSLLYATCVLRSIHHQAWDGGVNRPSVRMRYHGSMAHHAYFVTGDLEAGVSESLSFIESELGLPITANPDVTIFRYDFFGVEDARRLINYAGQGAVSANGKGIVIAAARFYHEAQNALLKLFEEPSKGTTLFLVLPSEAVLLPTLRSRLIRLSTRHSEATAASSFLALEAPERKKYLDRLLERTRADKEEVKQRARRESLELLQGLTECSYRLPDSLERRELLRDLDSFTRALHARSAPLKPVFEHLLLVLPEASDFHTPKV